LRTISLPRKRLRSWRRTSGLKSPSEHQKEESHDWSEKVRAVTQWAVRKSLIGAAMEGGPARGDGMFQDLRFKGLDTRMKGW
jgi:hypothetical protein